MLGLLLAAAVAANPGDGRWLVEVCEDPARLEVCHAFLWGTHSGITFALEAEGAASKQPPLSLYCAPKGTNSEAIRGHVLAWLKAHPRMQGMPAGGLVLFALKDALPCRSTATP